MTAEARTDLTIEHIFRVWDEALQDKDLETALSLYHPDVTLESPLVCHLLGVDRGVVRGRENLRGFVTRVFAHQPPQRGHFRTGYLSDGQKLTWEYPRQTPDGEQMDIVELMEIRDGLIGYHRIYWGWFGVGMLRRGEHPA